ncbi:MAG: hypothetical protein Q4D96_11975, partial [Propionibacteriaceae bacterium]|nr:hypothetical protein [Propionibacteriaceae bacterium]
RTFLTPDPQPTKNATNTKPKNKNNNNPLHTHDPQGLRPVTDNELQDYNNSNGSRIFNWKTLTGAALTVGGIIIGVGNPVLGGVVAGAGFNLASQGIADPSKDVDLMEVGVSAALGGVGGWVSAKFVAPLAQRIIGEGVSRFKDIGIHALLEGGVGGAMGAANGLITNISSGTSITSADFWKTIGSSAIKGAAENAFGGAVGRGLKVRDKGGSAKADNLEPSPSLRDGLPAIGSADVVPSPATPEVPTGQAPRRALIEPRRSSGIEAPTPGIPRRAMPDTESGYSPLCPPPRRALPDDVLEEIPI